MAFCNCISHWKLTSTTTFITTFNFKETKFRLCSTNYCRKMDIWLSYFSVSKGYFRSSVYEKVISVEWLIWKFSVNFNSIIFQFCTVHSISLLHHLLNLFSIYSGVFSLQSSYFYVFYDNAKLYKKNYVYFCSVLYYMKL